MTSPSSAAGRVSTSMQGQLVGTTGSWRPAAPWSRSGCAGCRSHPQNSPGSSRRPACRRTRRGEAPPPGRLRRQGRLGAAQQAKGQQQADEFLFHIHLPFSGSPKFFWNDTFIVAVGGGKSNKDFLKNSWTLSYSDERPQRAGECSPALGVRRGKHKKRCRALPQHRLAFLHADARPNAHPPPCNGKERWGIIGLWCNPWIAVLSGTVTRTGPRGVPAPCGLPQFMFPCQFYPIACGNCMGFSAPLKPPPPSLRPAGAACCVLVSLFRRLGHRPGVQHVHQSAVVHPPDTGGLLSGRAPAG